MSIKNINSQIAPSPFFLKSSTPLIMGIINASPDSFFDGNQNHTLDEQLKKVEKYLNEGANIIDVGGESTRPYSEKIKTEQEIERIYELIYHIKQKFNPIISIDTYKQKVAQAALQAGASIINDISAMTLDAKMLPFIVKTKTPSILCHIQGSPQTMQQNPKYNDVVAEVSSFLKQKINILLEKGVPSELICIDPGIGFGKTVAHNLQILKNLKHFKKIHPHLLIGLSRKSFIEKIPNLSNSNRLIPSILLQTFASLQGASIIRTHDVLETFEALKILEAMSKK